MKEDTESDEVFFELYYRKIEAEISIRLICETRAYYRN